MHLLTRLRFPVPDVALWLGVSPVVHSLARFELPIVYFARLPDVIPVDYISLPDFGVQFLMLLFGLVSSV